MSNAQPPKNIARDGAGKNAVDEIPTAHGMRNRAAPDAKSPLTGTAEHGGVQPLEDAENFKTPAKSYEGGPAKLHPSMTAEQRFKAVNQNSAEAVLKNARDLK